METTATASAATSTSPVSTGSSAVSSSPATSSTPASTPSVQTPASTPVQDGNQGSGALDHNSSVEAMVSAAANKGFGDKLPADTTVTQEPAAEATATDSEATQEATDLATAEKVVEDEFSYSFEQDGHIGARDLASKIDANPALKEALPADIRNEMLANARLAETATAYREALGVSPEDAKVVAQSAKDFAVLSDSFNALSGENVEDAASNFLQALLKQSAVRDVNGEPVMKDGNFVTDGKTGRFLNTMFNRKLGAIEAKLKESGDGDAIAAFDLVMERAGLRTSTAVQDQNQDPALAERKAALDRQQAELNRQRETATQQAKTEYKNALDGDLSNLYEGEVGNLLAKTAGLDEFRRKAVEEKLASAVIARRKTNTAYALAKAQIMSRPMSPERRAAEVALAKRFLRENLADIARPILTEAGISITSKAAQTQQAQAARAENARSEVSGGAASVPQQGRGTTMTEQQRYDSVSTQLEQKLGRKPSSAEVTQEMMILSYQAKTGSRAA